MGSSSSTVRHLPATHVHGTGDITCTSSHGYGSGITVALGRTTSTGRAMVSDAWLGQYYPSATDPHPPPPWGARVEWFMDHSTRMQIHRQYFFGRFTSCDGRSLGRFIYLFIYYIFFIYWWPSGWFKSRSIFLESRSRQAENTRPEKLFWSFQG